MSSPDSGRSAAGTNGSSSRRTYEDMYGDGPQERIADIQLDEALANEFKEAMISPDPPQRRSSVISSPGAFPGLGASYYYGGDEEEDEDTDDEYVSVLFSEDTDDEGEEEEDDDDEGYDSDDGIMPYDGNLDSLDEEDDEDSLTDITGVSLVSKTLRAYIEGGDAMRTTPSADTYNRVVVSAVSTGFEPSLVGNFQNFGVEVVANFSDFEPDASDTHWTPEQIAAAKARAVYKALGLPCIAECTTFEVSPVNGGVGRKNARYRFNRIGPFVDKLANFLEPVSDPNRMCQFRTVMCYYDGMGETFESGECEVAIVFADSSKALITGTKAIMNMCETLVGFWDDAEFMPQGMRPPRPSDIDFQKKRLFSGASMLRDRILKQARVLPNNIIDVSAFMESYIDMALMEECAKELADRFSQLRPTKILTVATTGLVIAAPMAVLLQVPLVYARKQRTMVMSDYHMATYASRTQNMNKELVVSKGHLSADDRVLIVDDFLSAGSCQDALLRIISDAGAKPVGIAVLVEKAYEKGRMFLSGYNLPIESLAAVVSVDDGRINLEE